MLQDILNRWKENPSICCPEVQQNSQELQMFPSPSQHKFLFQHKGSTLLCHFYITSAFDQYVGRQQSPGAKLVSGREMQDL